MVATENEETEVFLPPVCHTLDSEVTKNIRTDEGDVKQCEPNKNASEISQSLSVSSEPSSTSLSTSQNKLPTKATPSYGLLKPHPTESHGNSVSIGVRTPPNPFSDSQKSSESAEVVEKIHIQIGEEVRNEVHMEPHKGFGKEVHKEVGEEVKFRPPDGGYGWVVVMAAFVAQIWIVGFIKSYSIIYIGVRAKFPESSAYHTSWIQGMMITIGLVLSPVCGYLCKRFTTRKVSASGGMLCFVGIFLGSFATTINQLILSIGIVTGVGLGFITTTGILIVNVYFDKKRSMASGICISGNCIGAFVMTPLIQVLMNRYGLEGTLLICAAMQLHVIPAAMLFTPPEEYARQQALKRKHRGIPLIVRDDVNDGGSGSEARHEVNYFAKHSEFKVGISSKHKSSHQLDSDMLEVCMYRCVPLTSSVPNLRDFSYVSSPSNTRHQLKVPMGLPNSLSSKNTHLLGLPADSRSRSSSESNYCGSERKLKLGDTDGTTNCLRREMFLRKERSLRGLTAGDSESNSIKELETQNQATVGNNGVKFIPNGSTEAQKTQTPYEVENPLNEPPSESKPKNALLSAISSIFDPKVLRNPHMIVIGLGICLYSLGSPHALFFVHAHFTHLEPFVLAQILSISSLADLASRLGMGFVADTGLVPLGLLAPACVLTAGLSALSVPLVTSAWGAGLALSAFSCGLGGFAVLLPVVQAKTLGPANLPVAYGFTRMLMGCMNFVSPQITGVLIDTTGGYSVAYFFMGTCVCLSALVLLFGGLLVRRSEKRRPVEP